MHSDLINAPLTLGSAPSFKSQRLFWDLTGSADGRTVRRICGIFAGRAEKFVGLQGAAQHDEAGSGVPAGGDFGERTKRHFESKSVLIRRLLASQRFLNEKWHILNGSTELIIPAGSETRKMWPTPA